MPSLRTVLLFLASSICAVPVYALPFHAEVGYMYHQIETGGTELNPTTARVLIGIPVYKTVTLEALYAGHTGDDEINGLKLGVDNIQAAYLRFNSTLYGSGGNLSLFIGGAKTTLTTSINGINDSEKFEDFSWGVALDDRSRAIKNLYYSLEYSRFYDDDYLSASGISLGIKYKF